MYKWIASLLIENLHVWYPAKWPTLKRTGRERYLQWKETWPHARQTRTQRRAREFRVLLMEMMMQQDTAMPKRRNRAHHKAPQISNTRFKLRPMVMYQRRWTRDARARRHRDCDIDAERPPWLFNLNEPHEIDDERSSWLLNLNERTIWITPCISVTIR